jgi:hypothetical protein
LLTFTLALTASALAAEAPDARCPNPMIAILEEMDVSSFDANLRMVGARNGVFAGQIVLTAKAPFQAATAKATDLRLKNGAGIIPASTIQVRYAKPDGSLKGTKARRYDALAEAPGGERVRQVIWLIVRVPANARPGDYEGAVTMAGRTVPVLLRVCDWRVPDPKDFVSHVGLVQSPDSVALQYNVPQWSDVHFKLTGRTFDHLGQIGNKTLYLNLVCKTHFGNSESMVRWIRNGTGYRHDFAPLEKYTDLYLERVGPPMVVGLYIWDRFADRSAYGKDAVEGLPVTVSGVDPATGRVEDITGPRLGTEGDEAFWKPVLDGVRQRLNKRGIPDGSILLGIAGDTSPTKAVVESLGKLAPCAGWMYQGHPRARDLYGVKAGYVAHVWGAGVQTPKAGQRIYGWKQEWQVVVFPRFGSMMNPPLWQDAPLASHFLVTEAALMANLRGFGRVGADFWPVLKDARGRETPVINRYPDSAHGQTTLANSTAALLAPGPDGALSTVRFEVLRLGIQEAEARIFIEQALADDAARTKMGPELAKVCEDLLDERLHLFLKTQVKKPGPDADFFWFAERSGWQDRSERLFTTAGQVARATGRYRPGSEAP